MSNNVSNFPNARKRDPDIVRGEVEIFKEIANLPPIEKTSPKAIEKRINEYVDICSKTGLMPTIQGVSLALHIHRATFWTWCNEDSERGQVCQRFKTMQAALTENAMLNGTVNTIASIFLLKNHFGYKDQISIEAETTPVYDRLPSADDIRNRLILTAGGNENNETNDI